MSQTWTDNPFASGNVGQTDLQNIENNLLALKSMFSGAGAPSNPVAGMPWFDIAQKVQKSRNNDNDGWLGLFHGGVDQKILVYDDDVLEGYARDSGVTDKVVALKGGGTYTTGAATAGSFTITGFPADHNHKWYDYQAAATDRSFDSAGDGTNLTTTVIANIGLRAAAASAGKLNKDFYTNDYTLTHDGSDRPAAAVCILIYLDL